MPEIDAYDYELPRELIAQQPLQHRADARLLVIQGRSRKLHHRHIRDLPELLSPKDALVLNDTRVVPARLLGYRTRTGGRWSGLFISADEAGNWCLMSKTRGRLEPGETVTVQDREGHEALRLEMLADLGEGLWAAHPETEQPALQCLERVGRVPLPPYIRGGEMQDADRAAYQTVYAEKPGAVAAPTAGLHFTEPLLQALEHLGVAICRLTLHVGVGTFRPISTERIEDHRMHSEWGCIDAETVQRLEARRQRGGRVIAVGTTSARLLETAACGGALRPWQGETDLFIRPGYEFRATDALLTNFHLPKSTLLLLIHAFGGGELMRAAYQEAVDQRYRFYSYGDAMLVL